ncbi:protein PSK SIMULATOR 1-like [Aristolochia californica]|uniref:protein PSK SIMULATOR 1-like n=1 Tax=Aristolochia californica TaxID=171875 RepID=UPI0035DD0736
MVNESWLSRVGNSLWTRQRVVGDSPAAAAKASIGVLAFEVASLMSKVVQLWYSLGDEQIVRLRDETLQLPGVRKLVSDDDDYLLSLALAEMVDNLAYAARSVARLGRRCSNPVLQRLENLFDEMVKNPDTAAGGWEFNWKKMKRKVKKMEKFVAMSANLYQEMEVLTELEQGLRRMKANGADQNQGSFVEFQRKVVWQRQEVKHLRENYLWNRSFDYVVRLLTRSLVTVLGRIKHVFGIYPVVGEFVGDAKALNHLTRSQSVSALGHLLVHPSESNSLKFASGPLSRFDPMCFNSGPLGRSSGTKSGPLGGQWRSKTKRSSATRGGAFRGCITAGPVEPPPTLQSYTLVDNVRSNGFVLGTLNGTKQLDLFTLFSSKRRLYLNAPTTTLGAAALALHYANVIIVIEKMITYPHLIAADAREDLYNMLPTNIRAALRARLKSCGKNLGSLVYDAVLAAEWSEALVRILEWLSPLAHNMVRWQSERSFEQQHLTSNTNVLMLQTLYFANQAKTESAITELLVGLNYLCRVQAEPNAKDLVEATESMDLNEYLAANG